MKVTRLAAPPSGWSSLRVALHAALVLAGCATADPREALREVTAATATRGVAGAEWHADDGARAAALARSRALLAAPIDGDAAVEIALLRSPELQATLERVGLAQADLAQATRLLNPGVSWERLSGGGFRRETAGLFVELVDALVVPLRRRAARAELERIKLEVGDAVLELALEARRTLLEYQTAERVAERLQEVEAIERAAADFAAALHGAGNLDELELAHARAGHAEARAELARSRAEASRRREQVVVRLALDDEGWSVAPQPPALPAADPELPGLLARAGVERPDLAAARWAVDAVGHALAVRRRTRFVPVAAELGVEREIEEGGGERLRLTGPSVELRLPLFDTGAASIARLEAEQRIAGHQLAALEARARSEVRGRAADLAAARAAVALERESVLPLRREITAATLARYNQMLLGTFDVLLARRAELEAERRAIEAEADYWIARAELERAVGGRLEEATP